MPAADPPTAIVLPRRPFGLSAVVRLAGRLYDRHLQRCRLAELDDDLLNDIGVSREARRAECARPFWR